MRHSARNGVRWVRASRQASEAPAASALAETPSPGVTIQGAPMVDWEPAPGAHQSTEHAAYRLGGDASAGASALMQVRFPGFGVGALVVFILDMGISLAGAIPVSEAAKLWRDGLLTLTGTMPAIFASVVPSDASVGLAEIHAFAPPTDGGTLSRPNDLLSRLDLTSLGAPTRQVGPCVGFAARLAGPLSDREASELVAEG